jgi:CHAT domain-containing protein
MQTVRESLRLFRFQMSKVRLGPAYLESFSDLWYRVTRNHLQSLYNQLLLPIEHLLECRHLIIAPHGVLHHLPFHALLCGDRYLMDDYTISYAPSASIFGLCSDRKPSGTEESLVLGIPDSHTPEIADEVAGIAEILPKARLFIGEKATVNTLRTYAGKSRFIHLATHGLFRSDNPLFSSIQLGNSRVSLLDLYDFQIPADLVTLSGCSTGMNEVVCGDELIGLVRGLLYAGARSLLVSLWEVNDKSTAHFMKSFYANMVRGGDKASAMQVAMRETREKFPHPYHWAPFVMVGKYAN